MMMPPFYASVLLLVLGFSFGFPMPHRIMESSLKSSSGLRLSQEDQRDNSFRANLTVVIPAYNEADRIQETIRTYQRYVYNANHSCRYLNECSILVVDDGSNDETIKVVKSLGNIDIISLPINQGKGAAVGKGISSSSSQLILVVDADASANLTCLPDMVQVLVDAMEPEALPDEDFWSVPVIVVGDRGYRGASFSRAILRWGFRTTVRLFVGNLGDTQCGFKLMTASAGKILYRDLHLQRWTHDVEVLYRAKLQKIPIRSVPIDWCDQEGSKLVLSLLRTLQVSLIMLLQVLQMRIMYELDLWK
jgi:dolichyl-phosphate beta-glucosyltransferase